MESSDWDRRYAEAELVWSATPNQFVEEALSDRPPGRAVDLAAGEGRNALWLARNGWRVTAVDFAGVGLEKGRQVAGDLPVTWVCADVLTWEPDDAYDLAVVAYLQLPDDQRTKAVRRAWAALRPGGELFWVAHDSTNLFEGTGGPQDPDVLMTADDVLADLGGEEFEVIRAERVPRRVTTDDGHGGELSRTAYDCLVHLRKR